MHDDGITTQPPSDPPPEERITSQPAAGRRAAGDDDWFVRWGGKEVGPFTTDEMKVNATGGALAPDDPVRQGHGQWMPAEDVPLLAVHLRRRGSTAPRPSGTGELHQSA
jgi:hypothetical protein